MPVENPDFILYAQHGWIDNNCAIGNLAKRLATQTHKNLVIAASLGYYRTWIRIEPLIEAVENLAFETRAKYPDTPIRIIGHSMGGLIWLEILNRHREYIL